MTICGLKDESRKDASTGTRRGELSIARNQELVDDETFTYVEFTEFLLSRLSNKSPCFSETRDPAKKSEVLPMRKSLFAHVPPYIVFKTAGNSSHLPREIRKHLLWWHTKRYLPSLVRSIVLKSGFSLTLKSTANWCGTWCSKIAGSKFRTLKDFQKINHLPNSGQLSNKVLLWHNFRRMCARHGDRDFDFMPMTYVLPAEAHRLQKSLQRNRGVWIIKPPNDCAGRGIKIISRWYEVPRDDAMVAQRYLSRPWLVHGTKFDLRIYVLITCLQPLRVYLYSEGLVRLATERYRHDVKSLYNRFMHLTNTSVNKYSPKYRMNEDPKACKGNMWSLEALWSYLNHESNGNVSLEIWRKIKDIAMKTVISAEDSFTRPLKTTAHGSVYNFYQLYGFDVLLDEGLRPWLLEVNDCPSLDTDTPLCYVVKSRLVSDFLNLVGFHVPDSLSSKQSRNLKKMYGDERLCYDCRCYNSPLSVEESRKRERFGKMNARQDYLREILKDLTAEDTRVLVRYEDEIVRAGRFERIFPTSSSHQYFKYFEDVGYHNRLLDAWENEYAADRSKGIARLKELCHKKYHLSRGT